MDWEKFNYLSAIEQVSGVIRAFQTPHDSTFDKNS